MRDVAGAHPGLDHELLEVVGLVTLRTRLALAGPTLLSRFAADFDLLLDLTPIAV